MRVEQTGLHIARTPNELRRGLEVNFPDEMLATLKLLRQRLGYAQEEPDPIDGVIRFFEAIGPWYDNSRISRWIEQLKGGDIGQYGGVIGVLQGIDTIVENAGNSDFHQRRSGREITENNIYLGGGEYLNGNSIPLQAVALWKEGSNTAYGAARIQAENFLQAVIPAMIWEINLIETKMGE